MRWIDVILVLGVFLVAALYIINTPGITPTGGVVLKQTYDVTEHDIFDLFDKKLITSEQVTVKGIGLGSNLLEVLRVFGTDSYVEQYLNDDIINVQYKNEDNKTMAIFHFEKSVLERIVIRKGMKDQLVGQTKRGLHLRNITTYYGKPDKNEDISNFRIFTYDELGLELYHRRKRTFGFGLIRPTQS